VAFENGTCGVYDLRGIMKKNKIDLSSSSSIPYLVPTLLLNDFHNSDVVSLSFHPSPLYPHLLLTGFDYLVLFLK
jgi:hypothetical protein